MTRISLALPTLVLLLATVPATAQERWAVELRGESALPTRDLGDDPLGNGFGIEGTVQFRFLGPLAAYVGWDWVGFSPKETFAGVDTDVEETSYNLGLRFEYPDIAGISRAEEWAAWVRAGILLGDVEIDGASGDLLADSGRGVGWEAGGGLVVGMGVDWRLTPGVRFRSLHRTVEIGQTAASVELEYLSFGIGLVRVF